MTTSNVPPRIGYARELNGGAYLHYRLLEIIPGFLSWSTLILVCVFSYIAPAAPIRSFSEEGSLAQK